MRYRVMQIVGFTNLVNVGMPNAQDQFLFGNLNDAIDKCNGLRGLYPMSDYVVFGEQERRIVYRAADHNIKPNGVLYGVDPKDWSD